MHFTYYLILTFAQNFGYLVIFINPYVTFSIAVYHHLFIYLFKLWFLFFQYSIRFFGAVMSLRTGPTLAWSYFTHSEIWCYWCWIGWSDIAKRFFFSYFHVLFISFHEFYSYFIRLFGPVMSLWTGPTFGLELLYSQWDFMSMVLNLSFIFRSFCHYSYHSFHRFLNFGLFFLYIWFTFLVP